MTRFAALLATLLVAACASTPVGNQPSLAPRPAEAIDPRVPIADTSDQLPPSAELRALAGGLLAQARGGVTEFNRAAEAAERAAGGAGGQESDGWIKAQQVLSVAVAARHPAVRALADIDELVARATAERGGLVPADLANVRAAADEVAGLDSSQAARIAAIQARLAR